MLTLADGDKVGMTGLDKILEELWKARRSLDTDTAKEIVGLLAKENYIPNSVRSRHEEVVLCEYSDFLKKAGKTV